MGPFRLELLLAAAVYVALLWVALHLPTELTGVRGRVLRMSRRARRPARRLVPVRRRPQQPLGRPVEVIARDARRLGRRVHHLPRGTSYAKILALTHAYDLVLAEACRALGVDNLLEVLPPGEELDRERARVERTLHLWGLELDLAS